MLTTSLVLLTLLTTPPPPSAQVGIATPNEAKKSSTTTAVVIEVKAKLVEIPSAFPPDDLYDYAYVMKYQVEGGPLDKQFILVTHYKPTVARKKISGDMKAFVTGKLKRFKTGDTHRLRLEPDVKKVWQGAVIDDFFATDRTSPRYWCLQADPV